MTLSIIGMKPGDVYEDPRGRRFVVVGYWTQPVVTMDEGESLERVLAASKPAKRMTGGINGLMWEGFRLVRRAQDDGEAG